jgi:diguanylate cyclase (GGDEF)-like protein
MEQLLIKITRYIGHSHKSLLIFSSLVFVLLLGYLDYLSGFEFSFSLFYLLPVSMIAWFVNRNSALLIATLSALMWFLSNKMAGEVYSHPIIGYWNTLARLTFFLVVSQLLTNLRQSIEKERYLSRTDFLTGITNSRSFFEMASKELLRAKRYQHPLTVAYIDLDNFKLINDRLGHNTGDTLLRVVAQTLQNNLRRTDILARMGGDEFVLLLPETGEVSAKTVIYKAQTSLLKEMEKNDWDVTFSIGAITFHSALPGVDETLRQVDQLMYKVKANGKNDIKFVNAG